MKILSALIGAFMGLIVLGVILTLAEVFVDVPKGPGWWLVIAPFLMFTAWLAVKSNR